MSRSPSLLPALLSVIWIGAWIASCSKDESSVCIPGTTRLCAAEGSCRGVQSCLDDGSGYDACDCSEGPREGKGGDSMEGSPSTLIGRACEEDTECGSDLRCFQSGANDFFGGGPAHGYCSTSCTETSECTAIDPQSQCESGLCLRTCRSQDPTSIVENKCLTRADVVCQSEAYLGIAEFSGNRQRGLCLPQCGSDEDCDGRFCDLARGLCVGQRPTGAPVGALCQENGDCLGGSCVPIDSTGERLICTAPCVFGPPVGCGDGVAADPRNYACLAPLISGVFIGSEGLGDVGFCVEICDVDTDCAEVANGIVCVPDDRLARLGRSGFCLVAPPPEADAGADAGDPGDPGDPGDAGVEAGNVDAAADASN